MGKTCTYHCARCDRHFHSLDSFDAHRAFADPLVEDWDTRLCLDPARDAERLTRPDGTLRLRVWGRGVCRIQCGRDNPVGDVEIWQMNKPAPVFKKEAVS